MAKSTRYGGASFTEAEQSDPRPPDRPRVRRAEIGFVDQKPKEEKEEKPSRGDSSTPSTKKTSSDAETKKPPARKRAQTTANRSKQTAQASDVDSTDGDGQTTPDQQSNEEANEEADDLFDDDFS